MLSPAMLPRPVIASVVRLTGRLRGFRVTTEGDRIRVRRGDRAILLPTTHLIYVPYVVANFDTYWNAVADDRGIVDCSRPTLHRYRESGASFWFPSLPEEPNALRGYFHWDRPKPGDIVYDVGAYAGVTSYELAHMVGPSGRVVAFEPDVSAFQCLVRNRELHRLTNVTPVHAALAGQSGRRRFNNDGSLGASFSNILDRHGAVPTTDVECLTLADACVRFGVPAFVKMDVEGAEVEVIRASRRTIETHVIAFAIDTHHKIGGIFGPFLTGRYTGRDVVAAFHASGYRAVTSAEYGFLTTWAHR